MVNLILNVISMSVLHLPNFLLSINHPIKVKERKKNQMRKIQRKKDQHKKTTTILPQHIFGVYCLCEG